MPALVPTDHYGTITWLGIVPDRDSSLRSAAYDQVFASFSGVEGEDHAGLTRPSCSRVLSQYQRNTTIRNTRQFSVLCQEELEAVAQKLGVEAMDPAWLGASLVISGIPDFTHIPPSSRLQSESGATLTVDMENQSCNLPAPIINEDAPGAGRRFKSAANGLRGITAWVECEGTLSVGDKMRLHIPSQRAWLPT